MAYAFQDGERIGVALRRIVYEQIDRATASLTDAAKPAGERVHDARKRFKETRALLRMVRAPLGDQFAAENIWYRDAARDLAAARDAEAVVESIDKLRKDTADRAVHGLLRRARSVLRKRQGAGDETLHARVDNALAQLPVARGRVDQWPALEERFATIGDGMEKTYRDGRGAFGIAVGTGDAADFHEWRKRVKDHWYHMQLLRNLWPDVIKGHAVTIEVLSDALGDHHDLVVLSTILDDEPESFGPAGDVRRLRAAVSRKRTILEAAAVECGRRVFAESPRRWRRRIRAYWRAWRTIAPLDSEPASRVGAESV